MYSISLSVWIFLFGGALLQGMGGPLVFIMTIPRYSSPGHQGLVRPALCPETTYRARLQDVQTDRNCPYSEQFNIDEELLE